jgi:hypothetical protein
VTHENHTLLICQYLKIEEGLKDEFFTVPYTPLEGVGVPTTYAYLLRVSLMFNSCGGHKLDPTSYAIAQQSLHNA